jgi:deoxyribodipyrimidine photo-lyase
MIERSPGTERSIVVWFRRDVRVADHPALTAATSSGLPVVPLFVLDRRLLREGRSAAARSWFVLRSVAELDAALRARGSALVLREGRPEDVVPRVARAVGASAVLASRDVTPFSHRRDAAVAAALERDGRRLRLHPGLLLVEPETMLTAAGRPFGVFTPFWRSLRAAPRRALLDPVGRIESPPDLSADLETASLRPALGDGPVPLASLPQPGARAALERLTIWVRDGLAGYEVHRDDLDGAATSHLSAALHAGTLSPLQVEAAALGGSDSAEAFVRQLAWREFYHHRLFHRRTREEGAGERLTAAFRQESDDPTAVEAWREGRTGIPAVDAAMRQLAATGWMGNRARLVVASFLTRHLLMAPSIGERHFLHHLVDGDVANNRGGWEWTAGIGADAQPWFRIFNPVLQGRRFDPQGAWVRQWVPELAGVPEPHIHAPWEMPEDEARGAGVHLGTTYPRPIVDLAVARERALAAFSSVTAATPRRDDSRRSRRGR